MNKQFVSSLRIEYNHNVSTGDRGDCLATKQWNPLNGFELDCLDVHEDVWGIELRRRVFVIDESLGCRWVCEAIRSVPDVSSLKFHFCLGRSPAGEKE